MTNCTIVAPSLRKHKREGDEFKFEWKLLGCGNPKADHVAGSAIYVCACAASSSQRSNIASWFAAGGPTKATPIPSPALT
jgi:hypothetical protein